MNSGPGRKLTKEPPLKKRKLEEDSLLLTWLPPEVLIMVLENLDFKDLTALRRVNHGLKDLSNASSLWKNIIKKYFPKYVNTCDQWQPGWRDFAQLFIQFFEATRIYRQNCSDYFSFSKEDLGAALLGNQNHIMAIENTTKQKLLKAIGVVSGNGEVIEEEESDIIFRSTEEIAFMLLVALDNHQAIQQELQNHLEYPYADTPHNISDFAMGDALAIAAQLGHLECIKAIFEKNKHYVDFTVGAAFFKACQYDQIHIMRYLLEVASDAIFVEKLKEVVEFARFKQNSEILLLIENYTRSKLAPADYDLIFELPLNENYFSEEEGEYSHLGIEPMDASEIDAQYMSSDEVADEYNDTAAENEEKNKKSNRNSSK